MDRGAGLIRLALFGTPVRHSLSPRIHTLFAGQGGLEVEYRAIESQAGQLAGALQEFAGQGGSGCNITLPLKHEAMQLAQSCSERVVRAAAANTLVHEGGNAWRADNTDGAGLVRDLLAVPSQSLRNTRVAIIGAGGATAGILAALLEESPATVMIYNRSPDKAHELARRHADLGQVSGQGLQDGFGNAVYDLVINATSLGHEDRLPAIDAALFATGGACYDLNYGAAAQPLAQWCREHDVPYRDGLGMLVGQAAESFYLWTGYRPDAQAVLAILRASL